MVRRALPAAERRTVGPFVFFDQMGPTDFAAGQGLAVRPHPHIGLATVTYLFEGEILHRDSLGTVQPIRPGEVNWMTAGRGIVHSERTPPALRVSGSRVFGIQTWIALPLEQEEAEPAFVHFGSDDLPAVDAQLKLIVGELAGRRSPVPAFSPMFYADLDLKRRGRWVLEAEHAERAAYVAAGTIEFEDHTYPAGQMLVFAPQTDVVLSAPEGARVLLLGGAPLEGPRYLWWNFVSSRRDRIEQAAADWRAGRYPAVPGETEFIPLPEHSPGGAVHYP